MTYDVQAVGESQEVVEPTEVTAAAAQKAIEGKSPLVLAWRRLRRDRAAMISLGVIALIVACAIGAPVFATITGHGVNELLPNGKNASGQPVGPSSSFWLGTDESGRDLLVRIAYGARVSLFVGVVATAVTVAGGTVIGLAAGYFGGLVDSLLGRFMDWLLAVPFLLFAICLFSVAVQKPLFGFIGAGLPIVIIVLGFFGWATTGRLVRGQVLSIKEKEYIEAARALGAGPWRIMFIDILPNLLAPLIVYATLLIPATIVGEASLSFLGVGVQPPTADWGQMISVASGYFLYGSWWFLVFPSAALLITTLAFNIFGDGVRDAFDPRGDLYA